MDAPSPVKRLLQFLRFLIGVGLIAWLFLQIDPVRLLDQVRESFRNPGWLCLGLTFTFAGLLTGVFRWRRILAAEGLVLPLASVFQFAFIGQFFNAFMPGACGGDMARGYYVFRATASGSRAEAGTTVLVDRLIGLVALLGLCCALIFWRIDFFLAQTSTRLSAALMLALLLGAAVGGLVLMAVPVREKEGGSVIRRSLLVASRFLHRPLELVIAMGYSLGNAAFLTLACWAFGRALLPDLAMLDVLFLFPVITVLASVPLTPGALGIRENLFATLFATVGIAAEPAITMSLLVYLGGVMWSAFGGLCFLTYRRKTGDAGPS